MRPSALGSPGGSLLRHDVVVVGAGLAGMRAAIEAKRAGADVAIVSKLHPTRSHSGSAEGGINAALGNASEDSPEIHTFDTVKGSDYLGDQDAIEIMCTEAPGDIYELEHMGAVFSRFADGRIAQRPFGAAGSPRTVYSADITGHVLIHVLYEQLLKYDVPVYEEFFALDLAIEGGRCVGRAGLGHRLGRRARHLRAQHDPGHGRRRAHVLRHDQRLRLHGRRHVHGLAGGRAAQGHGVHAVPPDHAEVERRADHRGLPRRGRLPAQRQRRPLHGDRRAERDGARLARRRFARRDEGDRGGPRRRRLRAARPDPPRRQEDPHEAARLARAGDGLRGRRPDPRADSRPAGRPLPHGRRRHGRARPDDPARPLRRRRVRLRLGARGQPAGRQLAHGDDHLRPPRRQPRRPGCAREPQRGARGRLGGTRRRRPHPRDLRARRRPAALAGARGARHLHVRRRRRVPQQRAPRALPDRHRRSARARARRRGRRHAATASTPISSPCSSSRACSRWPTAS